MSHSSGKILVIRGGAIGDFILTLPVLAALRRQFPHIRLEILGYPHIAQLAVAGGLADATRPIEARALAGFFARDGALDASLQEYFKSFAVILSFLYDPDSVFQSNIARCSRAQFIAGPHRPDAQGGLHAVEVFLKPLERLAIFDADPTPRLVLDASRATQRALALHPGSGSARKNWPESRWKELLQRLGETRTTPLLLVGGEAEEDRLERLRAALPAGRARVARCLPLVELASELANCRAFLGHDSGITHLAAAVGLPGLALWGDTPEAIWRPRGARLRVLRAAEGLAGLTVEEVHRALNALAILPDAGV